MKIWTAVLCTLMLVVGMMPANQTSANTNFTDVGTTHRAQAEINYLVQGQIVSGVSSTQFAPDRLVTREEAATLLGRALGLNGEKRSTKFPDVSANNFASGYIAQMVEKGIISGFSDGSFGPKETLTRGQMALLISRSFNYGANSVNVATSALMNKGISKGIEDGTFGESLTLKRADFAVFLTRGINDSYRTEQTEDFSRNMYVNENSLNFRTGPNTNFPSIAKFNRGQKVEFAYSIGDWSYVRVNGQTGFLHSGFLQLDQPSTTTPPVVTQPPVVTPPVVTPPTSPTQKSLSELLVIIDPGHGGEDPGGAGHGLLEKNINLNVARHMNKYFAKTPIKTNMTRNDDYFVTLNFRTDFATKSKGDIFVSVHTNKFNGSANGQETFYYAKTAATNPHVQASRALAMYMQNRMLETWNLTNRGVNPFGYGNLHVLRENTMPATLVELGFIDNAKDILYLKSEVERERMGKALFLATLDYYYHFKGRQDVLPLYKVANGTPSKRIH